MANKFRSFRKRVKPEKKLYARRMRRNPTPAEEKLWEELRRKKLGVKFRRQAVIFGWIVDFYCPSHNLIVEVDGGYHQSTNQIEADSKRDSAMMGSDFRILRIQNDEVERNMLWVLEKIRIALEDNV